VLRMPDELFWNDCPITRMQHNSIRKEAADEIERLQAECEKREIEEKGRREKAEMAQAFEEAAQDAATYGQGFALVSAENVEHISAAEVLAQQPEEQHPDDAAVDRFAAAMKAKLNKKR